MEMKEIYTPIETMVGLIKCRDAIFLDDLKFDYAKNSITLLGQLNGNLCSKNETGQQYIDYSLTFTGLLGLQMIELDFSLYAGQSSFDMVENSKWLAHMHENDSASKVTAQHQHYLLMTYDDVFDVICASYDLKVIA